MHDFQVRDFTSRLFANGYVGHLLTVLGFVLAVFVAARLISEKKAPANTFAWLLVVLFIPYLGVPLFLIFGGRKLRRVAKRKSHVVPVLPKECHVRISAAGGAVAHTVAAAGGSSPVGGNQVQLLVSGEEEFAEWERGIHSAKHTIHVSTFILGRDDTGRRIVSLLARRAREGIRVRLLLDALGCMSSGFSFVRPLRSAGGEVARFMPVLPISSRSSANLRNHRKLAVFDHKTALIGGRNLKREYMGPTPHRKRWRDLGARIDGPAAVLLNEIFIADWTFATRQKPEALRAEVQPAATDSRGESELQVIASGPDVPGDPLYEGILTMIQEAEKSVWIVTPYFIPDDVLLRSLIVKARAGRAVTVLVPAHSNHPIADYARRYYTRELRRAGGRILLYLDGMMHSKAIVVDDRIGCVGSANFDLRSFFVNFELGVLLYSKDDVQALRHWIDDLVQRCAEPADRPPRRQILGGLAEDISRLLAPLL
ncbi:MAG: cardiolipin synthase [Opitutaceae bacterium]